MIRANALEPERQEARLHQISRAGHPGLISHPVYRLYLAFPRRDIDPHGFSGRRIYGDQKRHRAFPVRILENPES